jgi:hypothetical protein
MSKNMFSIHAIQVPTNEKAPKEGFLQDLYETL